MSPPDSPPAPARGDRVEMRIDDLAYGGRGVGRIGRFVVFVEGALPGEVVRAQIRRRRSGYAEASLLELVRPSPDRIRPRCEHYGKCGGCVLQHLGVQAQAAAKGHQVREILARVAGIANPPVRETVPSPEAWGYRFRMDLDWERRADGRPGLGLHLRDRPDRTFDIDACHLMSREAVRLALWMRGRAAKLGMRALDRRVGRGLLRRLTVQEARATGELLLGLETGRGDPPALMLLARATMRRFPRVVGIVRREIDARGEPAGISILAGRDHLFEEVEGDRFKIPASAFFQPNGPGTPLLRRLVIEALDPAPRDSILELHAGVGLFTIELARRAGTVVAVEGMRESAAAARENLARAGHGSVRVVAGNVAKEMVPLLHERSWDAILLDPPRPGLDPKTVAILADAGPPRMVYVSCDPSIMARDIRILRERGRYELRSVVPVDLFPQTHHVECVASLARGEVVEGNDLGGDGS
ncbi:MAG: 23S rRNA (uracil(1939)-C(5))-methyltransferase RlmD [Acidobacteria bacterium]|nr:23S rRNA (uracil(1939)-C(5))-methyltransferase RlmD [Acidobacteriota bacterium]